MGMQSPSLHNVATSALQTELGERFLLLDRLGQGGAGVVWRVRDQRLGVDRALKWVPAVSRVLADRLLREAKVAATVSHPNVMPVHDVFPLKEGVALVMDLALGSLQDWVDAHGHVPAPLACEALSGVLSALAQLHEMGIVHRDIKPSNLLIAPDGRVLLADFGVAQVAFDPQTLTRTGAIIGTDVFMAPEQRLDPRTVGHRADIYSVIATLLWITTGELPIDLSHPSRRDELLAKVDPVLRGIIYRGSAYRPDERTESASVLRGELLAAMTELKSLLGAKADDRQFHKPPPLPRSDQGPQAVSPSYETLVSAAPKRLKSRRARVGLFGLIVISAWIATHNPVGDAESVSNGEGAGGTGLEAGFSNCADFVSDTQESRWLGPKEALEGSFADLNADGYVDAVFAHQLSASLSVYWGDAQGRFQPGPSVTVGRSKDAPAVGDFDQDGFVDLLVPLTDDGALGWVRGLGARAFSTEVTRIFQPEQPAEPRAVDWDGDGLLDVVFRYQDQIQWRRGDGEGGFAPGEILLDQVQVFDLVNGGKEAPAAIAFIQNGGLFLGRVDAQMAVTQAHRIATYPLEGNTGSALQYRVQTLSASPPALVSLPTREQAQVLRHTQNADGNWHTCVWMDSAFRLDDAVSLTPGEPAFLATQTCSGCTSNHVVIRPRKALRLE